MTEIDSLRGWFTWLEGQGQRCIYFKSVGGGADPTFEQGQVLREAWRAACRKQVYLVQRRIEGGLEYQAIKPRSGCVPAEFTPIERAINDISKPTNQRLVKVSK